MKMTTAHYTDLWARVAAIADKVRLHRAELEEQHRNPNPLVYPVKDPERRLLWDTFHATRIQRAYTYQEFDYTDAHIETAMRAIFRELGI